MVALQDLVSVERRFALSARLDADLNGSPPLTGYVLQESVRKALEGMVTSIVEDGRCAYTWTGPYGGGKSCAALLVANLVGGSPEQRCLAEEIVGPELAADFHSAFSSKGGDWAVLALTGRRASLTRDLAEAAAKRFRWSKPQLESAREDDRELIRLLEREANSRGGLLILIDELGKFFEHAAAEGGDVHLLQDLSERAARSSRKLVLVGVLHQAFEQYAERLKHQARDEWAKVQGRFQNVLFNAQPDEVAALLARAISTEQTPSNARPLAERTAKAVSQRRPVDVPVLSATLAGAWPLHPITSLLLGPVSRQRFAQNERSVFGFLSSAEPFGFQSHLASTDADAPDVWFGPDQLWDYLVSNFGSALAAGSDSSRISLALEAVERASTKGPLCAKLAKAAAIIELFRNGSGLAVADDILALCAPAASTHEIASALDMLVDKAILIRQPRLGGYALFAGSDFDLDEALQSFGEKVDAVALSDLPKRLNVGPIAAKRHYFETGTLRTYDPIIELAENVATRPDDWAAVAAQRIAAKRRRGTGVIVLVMPDPQTCDAKPEKAAAALSRALEAKGVVAAVCTTKQYYLLRDHAIELYALDHVEASHPRLEGDRIARREIEARRAVVSDAVRRELLDAFASSIWWSLGQRAPDLDRHPLATVASAISDEAFADCPTISSELLNRDRPSSSAMSGRRFLGHAMVMYPDKPDLGIEGFPAERGLYLTILQRAGVHRKGADGIWRFSDPDKGEIGSTWAAAWQALDTAPSTKLKDIYGTWAARPFGIKSGVMPIMALAYLMAHRNTTAVYVEGRYEATIDEVFVDRLFQTPDLVEFKKVLRTKRDLGFLRALAELLSLDGRPLEVKALPIAAAIYQRFKALPPWTQRTRTLDALTTRIRDIALSAQDPEALLFHDLALAVQEEKNPATAILEALRTCESAYDRMLDDLVRNMADHVGVNPDTFEGLSLRAKTASAATTDLRLQAFAMRAAQFELGEGDAEGLASLFAERPARMWTDIELGDAELALFRFAKAFREAEALSSLKNRTPTTEAFSLMVSLDPHSEPLMRSFEVSHNEQEAAERLADDLIRYLRSAVSTPTVELAAVARLIQRMSVDERMEMH